MACGGGSHNNNGGMLATTMVVMVEIASRPWMVPVNLPLMIPIHFSISAIAFVLDLVRFGLATLDR